MTDERTDSAAESLARRLRLLLDVATVETGVEPTYGEIAQFLNDRGISLSRGRWSYMVNGHRAVEERALFSALAEFFGVNEEFLLGHGDDVVPPRVAAQLDLVRSMRAARVKSFAARTLGDTSPQALRAITRYLDEEVTGR